MLVQTILRHRISIGVNAPSGHAVNNRFGRAALTSGYGRDMCTRLGIANAKTLKAIAFLVRWHNE